MAKSLTEAAKKILLKEEPTMLQTTLAPGSTYADPPQAMTGPDEFTQAPTAPGEGENVGARFSNFLMKDATIPQSVPAEFPRQQAEIMEEEVEISEELQNFVNELVAQGLSEEEIAYRIDEEFEIIEEGSHMDDDEDEKNEKYSVDMSEHVDALLAGENLSEDFRNKAKTIFESAVKAKVQEELKLFERAYANTLEQEIDRLQEEMEGNVDTYLSHVVEEWSKNNEIQIEAGLRTELTEDFIAGLRNLFVEHYIDIPEDQVSVVEELASQVSTLENRLNEQIETNINLTHVLNESKKDSIITHLIEGLTDIQKEKFVTLAENVSYTDIDTFANKATTLRESYFSGNAVKYQRELDTVEAGTEGQFITEEANPVMSRYVKVLGRTVKN
tara:strand:+ start:16527 stop:17687 length:1161 start_codon:yes stop_codon:yes gene_type:complete